MTKKDFNKKLLERSKGDKTISQYVIDSNISYAYVSNILNKKIDVTEKVYEKMILSATPPMTEEEVQDAYETIKNFKLEEIKSKMDLLSDEQSDVTSEITK